ncbi:TetR/AcrR family transcriptional regulator [Sinomonas soli]
MGRTQAFDRETAVRAARAVFWQSGYEDASVPDLEQATGLSRSSIYNAFGSKRGLFDAAVQSYLDEVVRPRLRPLQGSHVEPHAVIGYLDGLREALAGAGSAPAANGCLLINAAGAPIAHDAEVARVIADYRDELRAAVGRGIGAHLPAATAAERERLADAVTGLVVAAFALVRIAPEEASRSLLTARGLIGSLRPQAQ